MERKLAAILAADVVGYSRLMEQDEAETLAVLKAHRESVIDPAIAERKGRIVKLMGDGTLVEFASVVEAVACAVAIQEGMAARNEHLPEERCITFRIGVHLGDVIVEGDDLYGDGVNVAARLEGLAEPGGICISQQAYDQVETKLDLGYEDLGGQQVKNIARPVHAYRVRPDGAAPPEPRTAKRRGSSATRIIGSAAAVVLVVAGLALAWWQPWKPDVEPASIERLAFPLPEKPSIAVLPFDNLSGDPEQDYWIDGTTAAIVTALSKTPNLFVIARESAVTYKGKPVEIRTVAEELGVRYVLDGSIQRSGGLVRLNAQLTDSLSGRYVWAEQIERRFDDLFALQDDLTREVITALEVKLTEGEQARIWRRQTDSQTAYELFRKGLVLYRRRTKSDNQQARELFAEASAADPKFADAACLEGFTHLRAGLFEWEKPRAEVFAKGRALAEQAIERDPDYPHAYALLGTIMTYEGDIDSAVAQYEKSLKLEPNYAANATGYAMALTFAGRGAEAVEQIDRAMRLSPYYPDWYLLAAGDAYRAAGRMDDALAAYEKRVERNPRSIFAKLWLAGILAELGRREDAEAMMVKVLERASWLTTRWAAKYLPYKDASARETILDGLRKAGLPENPPLKLPDKPSIAVLPFTNMSGDPEQEYFADGMTEDLTTDLSKISGLFVIARNSAFAYKGKNVDVRQVARELGVKYVLEGSVRRAGDKVRINAQLIDAQSGGHLWAERYDGTLDDVFALQDQVTQNIVTALAVNLTTVERERQARKETDSPQAYDAFLRGWAHYRLYTRDDFAKAVAYLEKAIQLDPNYGRAHAALAHVYWGSRENQWVKSLGMSYAEVREKVRQHLEEALKNPTPLAHRTASKMLIDKDRWDEAIAEAERAIALDANDPDGYVAMSRVLVTAGRSAEGLEFIETAMRLDPQSDYLWWLGDAQFHLERYDEAAATMLRATKRNPGDEWNFLLLAAAYGYLGHEREAKSAIETFNEMRAEADQRPYTVADVDDWDFKEPVERERLRDGLRKAGLPEGETAPRVAPLTAAEMRSLYPGNTITGENRYETQWHIYHAPNGKAFSRTFAGQTYEGTWEITDDGLFCEQWPNWGDGKRECYINFKKGDEYEAWFADGDRMISKFKIRPGNPENL